MGTVTSNMENRNYICYGHINAGTCACRLQSQVGLAPYSKILDISVSLALLLPSTGGTKRLLLHLQSFPLPQERNVWKSFHPDPPPPR